MPSKVMALIGDFYHSPDYLKEGLKNIERDSGADFEYVTDPSFVNWEQLNKFKLFILAKECRTNPQESEDIWMTPEIENRMVDFVGKGGSIFVLHSGLAGYQNFSRFREMIKGHFLQHPPEHPEILITGVPNEIGIAKGINDFTITDEQYFVACDEKDTEVFLQGNSEEFGRSIAGWAHAYGHGKVCCLTPGHTKSVLSNPTVRRLILNSIKWLINEK